MTPESLAASLATDDVDALRAAVRACASAMSAGDTRTDVLGLAAGLVPLARHASWKVRQTLAEACDAFPDPFFERAHTPLAADANQYVRDAAEDAAARRAVARKRRAKATAQEQVLAELLDAIERAHGKGARRLADRAVRRGVEHFVSRLDHELRKTDAAIDHELAALVAGAGDPDVARPVLARRAAALRGHFTHFRAVVRRARDAVAHVRPSFADERLGPVLDAARAHLVERLGDRAARLDLAIDVDDALRLRVDRHALLQALDNLLQNAVEAYPDGAPRLAVRVAARVARPGQVAIVVADEGRGMTDEERASLFLPFASRKPGGTGVGMLVVRTMIEDVHGGAIDVASAVDRGTTITLLLPLRTGRGR